MINAFITVRSKSSRLPEKCFLPFGDMTMIEHIIIRAKDYNLRPIVCTTTSKEDIDIVKISEKHGVDCFMGSEINKLKRWKDCCLEFNIDKFHSVDADDPFFCGDEIKRSYELLEEGYDMVTPSPSSMNGGATVGYSLTSDVVTKACKDIGDDTDTEMMWAYINKVNNIKVANLEDPVDFIINQRMTLDYEEDYKKLLKILNLVGHFGTREEIAKCLIDNPHLKDINESKNREWKQNQHNKTIK